MSDPIQVGAVFTTPSKTLTDAHFLLFSGITGDSHPIHYDVEYARATRFGKPLAHGLLLASLTALGASPATHVIQGFVFVEQGCRSLYACRRVRREGLRRRTRRVLVAVERLSSCARLTSG